MNYGTIKLSDAVLKLFAADANGNPATEVWMGARAENLEIEAKIEEAESTGSGAANRQYTQLGQEHFIKIDRVWSLSASLVADYNLTRGKFVLVVDGYHRRSGMRHTRTYLNVTALGNNMRSNGQGWFAQNQSFRAESYLADTSLEPNGMADGSVIPVAAPEQALAFDYDGSMEVGRYFLGAYRFPYATTITFAKVIARAPQSLDCTLTLEVNGSLTGTTLTLSQGSLNAEVSDEETLSVAVAANHLMRWKVTAGPSPVDAAWAASISMNVRRNQ